MANNNWKNEIVERLEKLENLVGEPVGEIIPLATHYNTMDVEMQEMQKEMAGFAENRKVETERMDSVMKTLENMATQVEMLRETQQMMETEIVLLKRAMAQTAGSDGTLVQKTRIPEPNAYAGERSAKTLENFLWDMEQYFRTAHIKDAERVDIAAMYLNSDAKLWWRTRVADRSRSAIKSWDDLKEELRAQFMPTNSSWQARDALRRLKHEGSVRDYVKQFSSLLLDINEMAEEDKVFNFMAGLQPWAQTELRRQGVRDLHSAITAADGLVDMHFDQNSRGGTKNKRHDRVHGQDAAREKGNGKDKAPDNAGGQQGKKKSRFEEGCFICHGPHFMRDCPLKSKLNTIRSEVQREANPSSVGDSSRQLGTVRVSGMQVVEPDHGRK